MPALSALPKVGQKVGNLGMCFAVTAYNWYIMPAACR